MYARPGSLLRAISKTVHVGGLVSWQVPARCDFAFAVSVVNVFIDLIGPRPPSVSSFRRVDKLLPFSTDC